MVKEITKKRILELLRQEQAKLSSSPNLQYLLTYQKSNFKNQQVEDFDVDVSFQNLNYLYIARELYGADQYGYIKCGENMRCSDFSYVSGIENMIKQLCDDGYILIGKQDVHYYTDYDAETTYDEDGLNEIFMDAKKLFLDKEKKLLETSITLTTKGYNKFDFWKDKIISEPIGIISLAISLLSLFISLYPVIIKICTRIVELKF